MTDEQRGSEESAAPPSGNDDRLLEELRAIRRVLEGMLDVLTAWRPAHADEDEGDGDALLEPVVVVAVEVAVPDESVAPEKGLKRSKRRKGRKN